MLRTSMTQKQCEVTKSDIPMASYSLEHSNVEPLSIIKTMMKVMKAKSKNSMDVETRMQFSRFADAVVRMVEEIRE